MTSTWKVQLSDELLSQTCERKPAVRNMMTSMSIIKKPEWHLWRKWPNACPVQFCGWRWSQALEFQYTVRLHLVILRTGREPYQHVYFSLLQCKSRKKQAQCAYELQDAAHSSSQQGIDTPGQVLSIDLKRFKSWNWLKCRTLFFFFPIVFFWRNFPEQGAWRQMHHCSHNWNSRWMKGGEGSAVLRKGHTGVLEK